MAIEELQPQSEQEQQEQQQQSKLGRWRHRRQRKKKQQQHLEEEEEEEGQQQQQQHLPPTLSATSGLSLPTFLDFLLAWSDRSHPRSVSWLWPALVLRGNGGGGERGGGGDSSSRDARSSSRDDSHSQYNTSSDNCLTRRDVERLFEPVRRMWVERGQYDALRASDVAAEVFDIVAPDRPGAGEVITKKDLLRLGAPMAGTVIGMLCDVGSFWEHDSRELQLQQAALAGTAQEQQQEEEEGEGEEGEEGEEEGDDAIDDVEFGEGKDFAEGLAAVEGGLASAA